MRVFSSIALFALASSLLLTGCKDKENIEPGKPMAENEVTETGWNETFNSKKLLLEANYKMHRSICYTSGGVENTSEFEVEFASSKMRLNRGYVPEYQAISYNFAEFHYDEANDKLIEDWYTGSWHEDQGVMEFMGYYLNTREVTSVQTDVMEIFGILVDISIDDFTYKDDSYNMKEELTLVNEHDATSIMCFEHVSISFKEGKLDSMSYDGHITEGGVQYTFSGEMTFLGYGEQSVEIPTPIN